MGRGPFHNPQDHCGRPGIGRGLSGIDGKQRGPHPGLQARLGHRRRGTDRGDPVGPMDAHRHGGLRCAIADGVLQRPGKHRHRSGVVHIHRQRNSGVAGSVQVEKELHQDRQESRDTTARSR